MLLKSSVMRGFPILHLLIPLTDPDLRDKLGIDRRQGRVEGSGIEVSVDGGRKKDKGGSSRGPDLELLVRGASVLVVLVLVLSPFQLRKGRVTAAGDVVQVHQDGDGPLAPVGREAGPVGLVHVEGVVVRKVLLGGEVAADLW